MKSLRPRDRFYYINGKLFHKDMDVSFFKNDKDFKSYNSRKLGKQAGSLKSGYLYTNVGGVPYAIHRIIFYVFNGYLPLIIDHIDGNPLNNKIENLREATPSQNLANTRISKNNTSGFKGVFYHKSTGKWQASVRFNGRLLHLGLFSDISDAVKVRQEKFNQLYGDFANNG